ncbi:DUF2179 domain-containing protein [Desertibacillus haloalkaliphilus]|uniref:DUF2179 domain-containing protein n=1 Tax=Desertibacillus haloalkaliphilus TaxID=1328930 RepID=UPI001C27D11D|nr:DUF2179 domain-containing protein [Desertibacillus haloalkaliphilus]MBU8908403.1 DUF2179 domain-containing protein [Desertibacillus haloalkaliphilus]
MLQAIIIFIVQLLYVPALTLRTILTVKGMRVQASVMGMIEGIIYVAALGLVFSDLSNYINMAAFALGFGAGVCAGSFLEEKLAIGYVTIEANIPQKNSSLINRLREVGFSVSTSEVEGMNSIRYRLDCTARRNREKEFYRLVSEYEPHAFVASYEPRNFKGGYITKAMKKRRELFLKRKKKKELEKNNQDI